MRALLTVVSLLWIDQAIGAPLRLSYFVIAPPVAGVWMAQETGTFKKYDRVDARTVATVLEFEPVQGVEPVALTRKVIDNSMVEKLVKDGFIEKVFGRGTR